MNARLLEDIVEENRANGRQGIYSVCSSHRWVIEAALLQARADGSPVLIEATCNQVNQDGGYTSMTPKAFSDYVLALAGRLDFPVERLILGGSPRSQSVALQTGRGSDDGGRNHGRRLCSCRFHQNPP